MNELFPNTSDFIRNLTLFWIDRAKKEEDLMRALQLLNDCRETMPTEEDKKYFDFSVNLYFSNEWAQK